MRIIVIHHDKQVTEQGEVPKEATKEETTNSALFKTEIR